MIKHIDYTEPANEDHALAIEAFEETLSKYLKVKYCLCVNSGTAGLMLALKALGLDKEVIVPSYTFCGTVHALTWNGITPKFTDINRSTFNLDLNKVRENITKKTTAILAVHMYGNPCEIESLESLARTHKLKLIFDSAHSFGCRYNGKKIGGFGDLEVFSLQSQKLLTVLEGGVISTNQETLYKKLRMLRSQGNRGNGDCLYVGLNARMHPFGAALGEVALKNIDKQIKERQEKGEYYRFLLSKTVGINFQELNERAVYNYQYMPLLIDQNIFGLSRNVLMQKLESKGIVTRKYFHPPVHQFSCYSHLKKHPSLKVTEHVADNIICLPFYASISNKNIEYICRQICEIQKYR